MLRAQEAQERPAGDRKSRAAASVHIKNGYQAFRDVHPNINSHCGMNPIFFYFYSGEIGVREHLLVA